MTKGASVVNRRDWAELLGEVARRQCRSSFKLIFEHFFPRIVAQAIKNGIDNEAASELAQESLLKVWNQASSYDSTKGDASLWIFVISRNTKFDYLRKIKKDPIKVTSADLYDELDRISSDQRELESVLELHELAAHISNLPHVQKEIMQKLYFEGMTQQEIALKDNIPLGTVKSRTRLALAQVRKEFKDIV